MMRNLKKNKRKMYYALQLDSKPMYDEKDGVIKYIEVDGDMIPVEKGYTDEGYTEPIAFKGNITLSGGKSDEAEYGIDVSNYEAVLICNGLPLTETSLIWFETTPVLGIKADPSTADYRVAKVCPSINEHKYLLKKVEK